MRFIDFLFRLTIFYNHIISYSTLAVTKKISRLSFMVDLGQKGTQCVPFIF